MSQASDPPLVEVTSERLIAELFRRNDAAVFIAQRSTKLIGGDASLSLLLKGDVFACLGLAGFAEKQISTGILVRFNNPGGNP